VQVEDGAALVEHPQHLFAVDAGQGREAQVDGAALVDTWMRPSWGRRRSAMSRLAITLRREISAGRGRRAGS
jgi:hypothetical protein